jgi:hypothetical protein
MQVLNDSQKKEINLKWQTLSNDELYKHLVVNFDYKGCSTSLRTYMYTNGMKKTNCLRWFPHETKYLLDNYQTKGNIEIAKKLSTKKRPFTKKNIQKKMRLLKISRTPAELQNIIKSHVKQGLYSKANFKNWVERKIKEGQKVVQITDGRPKVMIKSNGLLTPYARFRYEQLHGTIEKGMRVHFKDCNPLNISDENMELRKGCSYTGIERIKYDRACREYIKNKTKENPIVEQPEPEANTNQFKGLITVRINAKTVIQVKPGTDLNLIKERLNRKVIF